MSRLSDKQRHGAVKHAEFLIANGPRRLGYTFGGGLQWIDVDMVEMAKRFAAGETWDPGPDCRATILWTCKWSGWKSPTGLGWAGSSGEMFNYLPKFDDVQDCELGSLVVYGDGGVDHVAMVIGDAGSGNPVLFSHGSAFSGNRVSYLAETAYHAGLGQPVSFLTVGGLG